VNPVDDDDDSVIISPPLALFIDEDVTLVDGGTIEEITSPLTFSGNENATGVKRC
jgi:hypothetical protein